MCQELRCEERLFCGIDQSPALIDSCRRTQKLLQQTWTLRTASSASEIAFHPMSLQEALHKPVGKHDMQHFNVINVGFALSPAQLADIRKKL